jgi:hypothetical protein
MAPATLSQSSGFFVGAHAPGKPQLSVYSIFPARGNDHRYRPDPLISPNFPVQETA